MKISKSLKARQLNAIRMLAMGVPDNQVAAQLQVTTMTIYRWKMLPEFGARLNTLVESGLQEVAKKLNATSLTAVETLQEVLCDMALPTNTRMKAAIAVLGVMGTVNAAIEKSLRHGLDFDLQQRWSATYDSGGNAIQHSSGFSRTAVEI